MYSLSIMRRTIPRFGEVCQAQSPQLGERMRFRLVAASPAMGNNIGKIQKSLGLKDKEAADLLGMSKGGFLKIKRSERGLKLDHIQRVARAFGVPEEEVYSVPKTTRLVGYVGAGSEAHFYKDGDDPDEEVPMPVGGADETVAVEVRGESLGPFFKKWLVYYDDVRTPPTEDILRHLCVVGLADGRVLVKMLLPGNAPGLYHLMSQTEGLIENVAVEWAAVVRAMTPR